MVYAREIEGKTYQFGTYGLDQGTLILYDAESRSHWSQLFGEAVDGEMKGHRLEKLPSIMTSWGRWRELHPDTTVYVKRSTPYGAQFTGTAFAGVASAEPGPVQKEDLVLGVEGHVEARAYLARRLARQGRLVHDQLEGEPIAVFLSEDLATARVFSLRIEEQSLELELADGDQLRDVGTGSLWDPLSGVAVSGPMEGKRLQELVSTYSLWFAWQKYRPDTSLHGEEAVATTQESAS